jgi:hypothetical protein
VAFARVQASCKGGGQLADETVVGDAEVAELESEANEVSDKVRGVDAGVDEDGSVDVWVRGRCVDG